MLPRIEAGERLAGITDRAIATGNADQAEARRVRAGLDRAARNAARKAAASPDQLSGMGIGVRIADGPIMASSEGSEGHLSDTIADGGDHG